MRCLLLWLFTERDMKELLRKAVDMLPHDSEYYDVVNSTLQMCGTENEWENVWKDCEERYKEYNWIHAYPNAAAEGNCTVVRKYGFQRNMQNYSR